jgi:cysteinyl-tRNA synthetase
MLLADLHSPERVIAEIKAELGCDDLTATFARCILTDQVDVQTFVAYREDCRARGDYKTADWIRSALAWKSIKLEDTVTKTRIKNL